MEPNTTQAATIRKYNRSIIAAQAVMFLFASILVIAAFKDSLAKTTQCSTPVAITIVTAITYVLLAATSIPIPAVSLMISTGVTALFGLSALVTLFTKSPAESFGGAALFLAVTVVATLILANGAFAARKLGKGLPQPL